MTFKTCIIARLNQQQLHDAELQRQQRPFADIQMVSKNIGKCEAFRGELLWGYLGVAQLR